MNKNKKTTIDKIKRIFGIIFGIFLLLFGIFVLVIAVKYSEADDSLEKIFLGYLFAALGAGICVISFRKCSNTNYSEISKNGFVLNALCPFVALTIVILGYDYSLLNSNTGNMWLIIHAVLTGAWFVQKEIIKIKEKKTWHELELMRIDLYSTVSMIPLTLVWVIFEIKPVKVGFAILLGEFLITQFWVKIALIKLKEQSVTGI